MLIFLSKIYKFIVGILVLNEYYTFTIK